MERYGRGSHTELLRENILAAGAPCKARGRKGTSWAFSRSRKEMGRRRRCGAGGREAGENWRRQGSTISRSLARPCSLQKVFFLLP